MGSRIGPITIAAGPVLGVAMYGLGVTAMGLDHAAAFTAGVTLWCAVWWCFEAVPIPLTSLLPFALFPFGGVLDHQQLALAFGDKFVLLFMAGFMISRAAEASNAHLRVADSVIRLVGTTSNKRLIIGFMLATAFCSMWISNTATALIMLPVAIAVIKQTHADQRLTVCLLLAIAYGASAGGIATLIGTPPNGVFASNYEAVTSGTANAVDFLSWLKIGLPVSLVMLVACGFVLTRGIQGGGQYEHQDLGPWNRAQISVLIVIAITAVLWITRKLPAGLGGWSVWLDMPKAHDATVALLAVVVLFVLPSGQRDEQGKRLRLLDWPTAVSIPWGILLLFAGGLAIARAFGESGLALVIADALQASTAGLPLFLIILILCLVVTFLTEVTSNTATATLLMPILAASGTAMGVDPAVLMVPAALSASCAFMLPVATPPNAIVFGGSNMLTIPQMARYGLVLNLIGSLVIATLCYFIISTKAGLG
ncbi:MAG: SLC13 family permease [Phycisphaeraceae bacterium]